MSAFPRVAEPQWKPRLPTPPAVWDIYAGQPVGSDQAPADRLLSADEIWFAADPDASGAVAYDVLLRQCLGDAAAMAKRPALQLQGLDARSIEAAFDAGATTGDAWFLAARNAGIFRRFFDFNFNVNALALFGQELALAGSPAGNVSKYSLQLLYALRGQPAASEADLIQMMQHWTGTGRYAPIPMGSAASRGAILLGLIKAQLVEKDANGDMALSTPGEAFLQLLHPDCRDPDLPARIVQWGNAWPASRPNVERYLRSFFGKQARFSRSTTTLSMPVQDGEIGHMLLLSREGQGEDKSMLLKIEALKNKRMKDETRS